jgi:NADH-quinone oxidoreductase subunit N
MSLGDCLVQLAPELILLVGACVTLAVGVMKVSLRGQWVSPLALILVLLAFACSLRLGVPDRADALPGLWLSSLTFYTRCIALGIGALIVLVNWHQPVAEERGEYMAMVLFSLLGVLLTASANDVIVLFFAIELVSVPTYVLIALSREDARASEAAVKYFFLGALSAAVLAYGLSFLYGAAGTTTIHSLTDGLGSTTWPTGAEMGPQAVIGLLLVFGGLAFKVAAVPFHVYAPDVYEGAASPITGLLGFVPKFAGFVALVKVLAACNWDLPVELMWVIWIVAIATMTVGNVLALLQKNAKRILAYSSIAHTGYMLIALLVGPVAGQGPMRDGVAALLFYIAIYGAMNLGAFAVLTAFQKENRAAETLDDLAGMARRAPLAALALAICVFSLMGFPPTAGFLGKLYIFSSAFSLDSSHPFQGPVIALAIIGVINSAIAAAYYLRIAAAAYIRTEAEGLAPTGGAPVRWGVALCSIPMLVLFAWPGGLANQARNATVMLHDAIQAGRGSLTMTIDKTDLSSAAISDSSGGSPSGGASHD